MLRQTLKSGYRYFNQHWVKSFLLPAGLPQRQVRLPTDGVSMPKSGETRFWFHAASVGELESLWPLILEAAQGPQPSSLILTIFSRSAESALEKLRIEIEDKSSCQILYAGFSPWEGEWSKAIRIYQPQLFITAKYEAWPDLWMALHESRTVLAIIAARKRLSLQIAKKICKALAGGLPKMILIPCLKNDEAELVRLFPNAQVLLQGEPRWDRVMARSKKGSLRAKQLIRELSEVPRPWGVIGSSWLEDLQFLAPVLEKRSRTKTGTLWVVPHRVDSQSVTAQEDFLKSIGRKPIRTTSLTGELELSTVDCLLVDEMGFLSELYSAADWVFVGGGFGDGIHSTIEPAIHGIPIGGGPKGQEKFSEIQQLSESGQLTLLRKTEDLVRWHRKVKSGSGAPAAEQKARWVQEAQDRCGATQKIMSFLRGTLEDSKVP